MSKILVIVESPAKCKKIESYLGSNYIVKASFGHLTNLNTKKGLKAIDITNNFNPEFIIIKEKIKYLNDIKKTLKKCKEVIIATDLDREGEGIGYHIVKLLNLDLNKTKRIIFNQITKSAIQHAIKNPTYLNDYMIKSQQTRQILDYLIGFDISPVLWKYVDYKTSAGRCQSPALNLICKKEMEIIDFKNENYYEFNGIFLTKNNLKFECYSNFKLKNSSNELILNILHDFKKSKFKLLDVKKKTINTKPSCPYTTSLIQQDSSLKLGLSPKITMQELQKLYEEGIITYMRTDSKFINASFLKDIKSYILMKLGEKYYKKNIYKNNTKNAQEAHECIRPTNINLNKLTDKFNNRQKKLYNLIWRRTVASQMENMVTDNLIININSNENEKIIFEKIFKKIIFLGYQILYDKKKINEIDDIKDNIFINQKVKYTQIVALEKFTNPKKRYTDASLIKKLEKEGIGRPSTFSSIIEKLYKRNYIIKKTLPIEKVQSKKYELINNNIKVIDYIQTMPAIKKKIFPTELGIKVNKFISKHFSSIINLTFTSDLENNLDKIANGELDYLSIIKGVFEIFHPIVLDLKKKKINRDSGDFKPEFINPYNNKSIYIYKNKYGGVIKEGDIEPKYVNLSKNISIQNLNKDVILELLTYPKKLFTLRNKDIYINIGTSGFYIIYENKKYSIDNIININNFISKKITLKELQNLIENKEKSVLKNFKNGISLRIGKYGPYILDTKKRKIYKIPYKLKSNPEKITEEICKKIIKNT